MKTGTSTIYSDPSFQHKIYFEYDLILDTLDIVYGTTDSFFRRCVYTSGTLGHRLTCLINVLLKRLCFLIQNFVLCIVQVCFNG